MKDYLKNRTDYMLSGLSKKDVDEDPLRQFEKWFKEAGVSDVTEPNAMALSTVDPENKPHTRIVLLRDVDDRGFVFFTNYQSAKAEDLKNNPNASLLFFWPELERQVRIEGEVGMLDPERSDAYFKERPRESRIGAWASPQSREIKNRRELEEMVKAKAEYFNENMPDRPDFWGGYVLKPTGIEFWQGRANRLHDRIKYIREKNGWKIVRLAP